MTWPAADAAARRHSPAHEALKLPSIRVLFDNGNHITASDRCFSALILEILQVAATTGERELSTPLPK
jgi:hypothetical protein